MKSIYVYTNIPDESAKEKMKNERLNITANIIVEPGKKSSTRVNKKPRSPFQKRNP